MSALPRNNALSKHEIGNLFRHEVKAVCRMKLPRGRPSNTVVPRQQMTLTVGRDILAKLIAKWRNQGYSLPPEFLNKDFCDEFARGQIQRLSATDRSAVHPDPFEQLAAMTGDLIEIGQRKNPLSGRPEVVRVLKDTATPLELRSFANGRSAKQARENILNDKLVKTALSVANKMPAGATLEEEMERRRDLIAKGKKVP